MNIQDSNSISPPPSFEPPTPPSKEKISFKDKFLNFIAFGGQFAQIRAMKKINPILAEQKEESLKNHVASLSNDDKWIVAKKLLREKSNFVRTIAMRFLHPPKPFTQIASGRCELKSFQSHGPNWSPDTVQSEFTDIHKNKTYFEGDLVDFYTEDHQQLSGSIVYAEATKSKNKPVIVMAVARNAIYEEFLSEIQNIAKDNDVNILVYHSRGSGRSLGKERSTDNAIEDCHAAMKYAVDALCPHKDSRQLGLMGYSWGGGVTAGGLEKFNEKENKNIGLYINFRSFSSLHHYGKSKIVKAIIKVALRIFKINPLHTAKILSKSKLADKTVVMQSAGQNFRGAGRDPAGAGAGAAVDRARHTGSCCGA